MSEIVKEAGKWLKDPIVYRRFLALGVLFLLLWVFRNLAIFFLFFFLASRGIFWLAQKVSAIFRGHFEIGLIVTLVLLAGMIGFLGWLMVHFGFYYSRSLTAYSSPDSMGQYLRELRVEILARIPSYLPVDLFMQKLLSSARDFFKLHGFSYANGLGRGILHALVGLVVSVVYLFDKKRVDAFVDQFDSHHFFGILRDYIRYIAEAILITIKLQVLVALVNTLLTLPVLLVLKLPRLGFLIGVIFFSSLIPILGNFISGAVLVVFSYIHQGITGVFIFLTITALLHKVEAYYLNPRLSSKHVKLPTVVLIFSLIAFEHLFGILGIFISFPCLYVGIKITQNIRHAIATSQTRAHPHLG